MLVGYIDLLFLETLTDSVQSIAVMKICGRCFCLRKLLVVTILTTFQNDFTNLISLDVLKSHEARVRFLEEEVESLKAERLKMEMDRNNYHKEVL